MTANRIIATALREVGVTEYPYGSNKVKYNTAFYGRPVRDGDCIINGRPSFYPWCMVFVWWCFQQAGAEDLFYDGGKVASCGALMRWAQSVGKWVTSDYMPGDVVIFDFTGKKADTQHVGIVDSVAPDGTLTTVEGNTSTSSNDNGGAVMQRIRKPNLVVGAYRPNYETEDDEMTGEEIYAKLNEYLREKPVPEWAEAELQEAVDMGITDGSRPCVLIPRYQAAIMAKRAAQK